jgi:hypothetical protein
MNFCARYIKSRLHKLLFDVIYVVFLCIFLEQEREMDVSYIVYCRGNWF